MPESIGPTALMDGQLGSFMKLEIFLQMRPRSDKLTSRNLKRRRLHTKKAISRKLLTVFRKRSVGFHEAASRSHLNGKVNMYATRSVTVVVFLLSLPFAMRGQQQQIG